MILLTEKTRNGLADGERSWDPAHRVIVCDWVNAPKKSHLPKIFRVCSTVTWVGPFFRFTGPSMGSLGFNGVIEHFDEHKRQDLR